MLKSGTEGEQAYCLVLSCLVLSCLDLSCLDLSCLDLSCLVFVIKAGSCLKAELKASRYIVLSL